MLNRWPFKRKRDFRCQDQWSAVLVTKGCLLLVGQRFCKNRRKHFLSLSAKKLHVGAINLLALVFGRVRTRDVETPILHKVEIGISTACFPATRKAFTTV